MVFSNISAAGRLTLRGGGITKHSLEPFSNGDGAMEMASSTTELWWDFAKTDAISRICNSRLIPIKCKLEA